MIQRRPINLEHPRVREIVTVLQDAGGPMRQRDIALRVFQGFAQGGAMVATYMAPLLRSRRVRLVKRGLYELLLAPGNVEAAPKI